MIPDEYFDRFDTPKYRRGGRMQRMLIRRFVERLHSLFLRACPVRSVLEIGCGEGFLSGYLSERFPDTHFVGVDLSASDLSQLRAKFPRIEAHEGSAYELGFLARDEGFDLVMCCEVMEHLDEPARALAQMEALRPRHLIITVPHEPWFMLSNLLRGKNLARLGNDPEHVQHWGAGGLRGLLETRFDVLELTRSYPWLLALLAARG